MVLIMKNFYYENIYIKLFQAKQTSKNVLIALHGFAGDCDSSVITEIANEMVNYNYTIVTFDLPNHGNSPKKEISIQDCLNDLKIVENFVKNQFPNQTISYFATSFGAFLLLNYLNNNSSIYHKIILRAPAIFMDEILKDKIIPEHNFSFTDLQNKSINLGYQKELIIGYNFYEDLKNYSLDNYINKNKLYVIQGKKDDVVDYKENEKFLKSKCGNNYEIYYFENADHRFKNEGELNKIVNITKDILLK